MMLTTLAAMLVVLLGCAGLAVDVANAYVVRGILQYAVDDAARTAQRWSTQVDDPGADPAAVQAQAVAAGIAAARRDVQAHGLAAVTVVGTARNGPRVRIAARASVPTWFLRAFGVPSWVPSASADVVLWTQAPAVAAGTPATSPAFPAAPGPPPTLSLPEGPSGGADHGLQPADTGPGPAGGSPGPGPADGSTGAPADAPGGGGGDIMEGP